MQQSVSSQGKTATKKISDSFDDFRIDKTNVDSVPEATLEWVPCIWCRFRWPVRSQ